MKDIDISMPPFSKNLAIKTALLGIAVFIPYQSALAYLWRVWKNEDFNYCYLIPLITVYIIWEKRHLLTRILSVPSWMGLVIVIPAVLLFFVGELGGEYYTLQFSLCMLIIGLCWLLAGWHKLRVLIFPLSILVTAIPFPWFIYANLTLRLKLISSQLGVWMLHVFGFTAYREGNVIDLGFTQLQVVDACSGLRYLLPLFVLSIIMVYFYRVSIWKKIVIVLSTVPLTIITNSLRIALTGVLFNSFGPAVAEGFFHGFSGWFIFIFAFAILFLEMWLLNKIFFDDVRRIKGADQIEQADAISGEHLSANKHISLKTFLQPPQYAIALALLALTAAIAYGIEFREKVPISKSLSQFPLQVGSWNGAREYLDQFFIKELDFTDYVIVNYQNSGKTVNFYIAWYENQRKGESIHSPESCLPGTGWIFNRSGIVSVPMVDGRPLPVNRAIMEKSGHKQIVYYWFPMRGRVLTSTWEIKICTFWDALTKKRTDGALVRIISPISGSESVQEAESRLQAFTREIVPVTNEYLPSK